MDILISDSWLRKYLKTSATPKKLAEYLSLSGPSVDRLKKKGKDFIYHIEITTNRVDNANIYGIAREASAILPRFGAKVRLLPIKTKFSGQFAKKVRYLDAKVDPALCPRFAAVLIKNIKIKPSPLWVKESLLATGVRPINNVVDISNLIMHEIGQPVHTFDYDKILGAKMILRKSRKNEKITTLDNKKHLLAGNDIVIEDGEGRLIDLAGIMGGKKSAIDAKTKNVLLFVQTYNPVNIRKTSMGLAKRTEAAILFEKGLDTELVTLGIKRGIDLFVELADGKPEKKILDIYPKPYKAKRLSVKKEFIEKRLGIKIEKKEISKFLRPLGFETTWKGNTLKIDVPSFREKDVDIPEDIIEEIARIYGYHNFPSEIMKGSIPNPPGGTPFEFERKVKNNLKGFGGVEIYTLSLVQENFVGRNALKIKNPLGKKGAYLRTSLQPSLVSAAQDNSREVDPFFIFEMSNVYLPRKGDLPNEKVTLAGIFSKYSFREAKGIVEALFQELSIIPTFKPEDGKDFLPSKRLKINVNKSPIGEFGVLENNELIYFELDMVLSKENSRAVAPYVPIPKYPAQIEDITFVLPERTKVGEIISTINKTSSVVNKVSLDNIYKDAFTFRIWYQHPKKTLTDEEVEKIRNKILTEIKKRYGAVLKA